MFVVRFTMYFLLLISIILVLSAAYTAWRVSQISSAHQPDGSFAEIDGVKLHYHLFPADNQDSEAPVLVFIHGASGNAYDPMITFKDAFDGKYTTLFVDRPGLGFSERDFERHSSLEGQAGAIAGLLEHLDIKKSIVVGHSFGAAVTVVLALTHPERVAGLAFIAPVSHPWQGGVDWHYSVAALPIVGELFTRTLTLPLAERLAPAAILRVFAPGQAPERYAERINLPLLYRPQTFRANSTDIATLKPQVTQHAKSYHKIRQPAVVVTGADDTIVWPSIHSEGLRRDLPNAELIILEKAGHMPHHLHNEKVIETLETLIERVMAVPGQGEGTARKPQLREPA